MNDAALRELADAVGLIEQWEDSEGNLCHLDDETRHTLLKALGFDVDNEVALRASTERLQRLYHPAGPDELPPLISVDCDTPIELPCPLASGTTFTVILETGEKREGQADHEGRLPAIESPGYHRLQLGETTLTLAVAPRRCFGVADACGNIDGETQSEPHLWGLAVQVYSLRRTGAGGIGDTLALAALGRAAAERQADALVISPMHAMFSADTQRYSPYSPSSRLLFNVLYASPRIVLSKELVEEAIDRCGLQEELARLEAAELIDWPGAAQAKLTWLRELFVLFQKRSDQDDETDVLKRKFNAFRAAGGELLEDHCRFEALQMARSEGNWRDWPEALRDPRSHDVARFAQDNAQEVTFHAFLQWLVAEGLEYAQDNMRDAGMALGLIADLAVGADGAGSQTWSRQEEMLEGVSIGAPPDSFNVHGQDWGLASFSPHGLVRSGFRSFIDMLRTAFRHAGGLRIDHILGLLRLWLVPHGASAKQGGYIRFPLNDMLRLVALESWRHRAIVIGEDLGTVAPGFRDQLAARGILGMRVLWFEQDTQGDFIAPDEWTDKAAAMSSTHDLPTVAGWWSGYDIDLRDRFGLLGEKQDATLEHRQRDRERVSLARALGVSDATANSARLAADDIPLARILDASAAYLGHTPSPLVVLPMEDALGLERQPNLPGTVDEHPNWRRRWAEPAGELLAGASIRKRLSGLDTARHAAHKNSTSRKEALEQASPTQLPNERTDSTARNATRRSSLINSIRATVRLQFHSKFTLDDALPWIDYYADLGISHVYASPLLASRSGSTHGYDGIDPTRLDPELGGEEALERLVTKLRERDMGLILDIVPNHVAVGGSENLWWQDVLTQGQRSPYANYFDIDWHSPDPLLSGKVLLPFLGGPYGEVLHSGELKLSYEASTAGFYVAYHEHHFPIDPLHYGAILRHANEDTLQSLARRFDEAQSSADSQHVLIEARERLAHANEKADVQTALQEALACFDTTDRQGAAALHELLEKQHYRLAFWRTASDEINWRRFFDITELGGLRVEVPEVFDATHSVILRLVERGWVDGLRVDHVDGLADPGGYCRKLRQCLESLAQHRPDNVPRYVALYVEKILAEGEALHTDWGVDGTTGYEFMNEVSGLQHDPAGAAPLRALWRETSGRGSDFLVEVRKARAEMLESALSSEFHACARALLALARHDTATRDITLGAIERVLKALVVHFPVYRTYADAKGRPEADRTHFEQAKVEARGDVNPPERDLLDQLDRWLGEEAPDECQDEEARALRLRAMQRFQQLTSPVAAKAVEDTAGYRSTVLISRNDVGFDPQHFSHTPAYFHEACRWRAEQFPLSLVTTATHDHKRGEDVRARLAVLSELPGVFAEQMRRWHENASSMREEQSAGSAPSPGDELILYQMLLGAWAPNQDREDDEAMRGFAERIAQWQEKALREAKLRSHWLWPDSDYEAACRNFLFGLIEDSALRNELSDAARALDLPGAVNGLVQVVLRLTVPGVPDLYQGTEFWDYSLVDPDNRRSVHYQARQTALAESHLPQEALTHWRDGRVKQAVIARLLALRQGAPTLFAQGDYTAITVEGGRKEHVVAFSREHGEQALLVVVPRLPATLLGSASLPLIPHEEWSNTRLQIPESLQGQWRDVLTGNTVELTQETIMISELLAHFTAGVFVSVSAGGVKDDG
ncbi:malto-oligosyltrehalose synthase [Halomonas sp. M20]|uniref:malto-oligosyltrehalose synthase n=1 Tax=Halomonas sp. M20 TaxID=2763264 RepID=UPI001D0A2D95|nr:malto-oligosyltrehalose synthase [Halomonas sp. M20]